MFRNYFTIGLRTLIKNKGYSFLNISGLAVGVTCFILILLFIQDELSYDKYHSKADRIYRVTEKLVPAEFSSSQPFSVAPTLLTDYPNYVEEAVRFFNFQSPSLTIESSPEKRFNETRFFFVDSTVFEVFDYEFVSGNPETALDAPNKVVLTATTANKYFGNENPVGKRLRYEHQFDMVVSGIIEDVPKNSHFEFDFLASFSSLRQIMGREPRGWYWNPAWTYVLLKEGVAAADLEAQFPAFIEKYFPERLRGKAFLYMQPLTDIHLKSHLDFEIRPNSDIIYVYIFSGIAGMVLLIACINFMNLATARSAKRAREVGMRKVLGADRNQLIGQFLSESTLFSLISVALSIPMTILALPFLNKFLQKEITFNLLDNPLLAFSLLSVTILVGLVAGVYPAFVLSAFRPIAVLKGKLNFGKANFDELFRRGLVVAQFAISMILIIGTMVAYQQLRFFQNSNLGFNKEQVIILPILRTDLSLRFKEVKQQFVQHPEIIDVTTTEFVPGTGYQTHGYTPQGFNETEQYQRLMVGRGFASTMGLQLLAGRDFSENFLTDDSMAVIINETMIRHLGWGSPEEAVGKEMTANARRPHYVIGVVKDFNYASLHNPISPLVLDMLDRPRANNIFDRYLAIRVKTENMNEIIEYIGERWAMLAPNKPFDFFFMDDDLDKLYRAEEQLGRVAGTFALFAIGVACLGLFGLASFTAEQRTKEIGVRKVLGASVANVVLNLSKDFMKLVGIAVVLAWPVAYFATDEWLQVFAYRTSLTPVPFITAGVATFLIAWLTVAYQAVKAALINPVQSLKYE